jgi:hypothetical protein
MRELKNFILWAVSFTIGYLGYKTMNYEGLTGINDLLIELLGSTIIYVSYEVYRKGFINKN